MLQVISRRELTQKPTWAILGVPREMLAHKYSGDLADKLNSFKRVNAK
jgi:hypothetical protein